MSTDDSIRAPYDIVPNVTLTSPLVDLGDPEPAPIPARMNVRMPKSESNPVSSHYSEIKWPGFEQWNLVRFATPRDNNCLFHGIANAYYKAYRTGVINGQEVSRDKLITEFRRELSETLASKISDDADAPTYYATLNNGNTAIFAKDVPEFELAHMQEQLRSQVPIGYGYMEFIGNTLDKDIYILDGVRQDIYVTDELPNTVWGSRPSIVLFYLNGHYELVGIHKIGRAHV